MMSLAIFDLDYTLLDGDSEWLWSEFLAEQGIVGDDFVTRISQFYQDYDAGVLDIVAYENFLLQPLTHLSFDTLIHLRNSYLERIRTRLRPFMLERLAWHRARDHNLLLITAANAFLAEPIRSWLGIANLICTDIETENGIPTGRLVGIPAFRQGKIKRLDIWLVKNHQTLAESWGYSDSHNDLPLLERVTFPTAVTPDSSLRKKAVEMGWEIID
jgi:HAD superfamily hydrolase (TIGR01490 family)